MKKLIISIILIATTPIFGQNAAQNAPIGKSYKALTCETCKMMNDGGCVLYTYQTLTFSQDSVWVSSEVFAQCSSKEKEDRYNHSYNHLAKSFKWNIKNDIIEIEGFDQYGKFTLQNLKLIATNQLEFIEEIMYSKTAFIPIQNQNQKN